MSALLAVDGVSVAFGGLLALDGITLDVTAGEVLGVIGPNGAGKTTLFNVVCGFVPTTAGSVSWQGRELTRIRPHRLARRGIARTMQGLGLFPTLSVLENVMTGGQVLRRAGFASALLGLPRSARDEQSLRDAARDTLASLGIDGVEAALPASLPYPVQKRVALARALVANPTLLLLDEPASGLAADEMAELGVLIRSLRERMTVVLVEHHMDLVMSVCDRVAVLDFGRLIACGSPAVIKTTGAVIEAYLGRDASDADPARAGDVGPAGAEEPRDARG